MPFIKIIKAPFAPAVKLFHGSFRKFFYKICKQRFKIQTGVLTHSKERNKRRRKKQREEKEKERDQRK